MKNTAGKSTDTSLTSFCSSSDRGTTVGSFAIFWSRISWNRELSNGLSQILTTVSRKKEILGEEKIQKRGGWRLFTEERALKRMTWTQWTIMRLHEPFQVNTREKDKCFFNSGTWDAVTHSVQLLELVQYICQIRSFWACAKKIVCSGRWLVAAHVDQVHSLAYPFIVHWCTLSLCW